MEQHCWEKSQILHFTPRAIVSPSLLLPLLRSLLPFRHGMAAHSRPAGVLGSAVHWARRVKSDCIIPAAHHQSVQSQCLPVCAFAAQLHALAKKLSNIKTPQAVL